MSFPKWFKYVTLCVPVIVLGCILCPSPTLMISFRRTTPVYTSLCPSLTHIIPHSLVPQKRVGSEQTEGNKCPLFVLEYALSLSLSKELIWSKWKTMSEYSLFSEE